MGPAVIRKGGIRTPAPEANIQNDLLTALLYIMCRYLHVVCTTLLVGGTLFYEMVVPVAIGELREESQLAVFGRARWVFRWIVWPCALLLILSGLLISNQYWDSYTALGSVDTPQNRPGWWWAAHVAAGMLALLVSLMLTVGPTPPDRPLTWMRFNLILLLVVMFLGSATRHVRDSQLNPPVPYLPLFPESRIPAAVEDDAPAPASTAPFNPAPATRPGSGSATSP